MILPYQNPLGLEPAGVRSLNAQARTLRALDDPLPENMTANGAGQANAFAFFMEALVSKETSLTFKDQLEKEPALASGTKEVTRPEEANNILASKPDQTTEPGDREDELDLERTPVKAEEAHAEQEQIKGKKKQDLAGNREIGEQDKLTSKLHSLFKDGKADEEKRERIHTTTQRTKMKANDNSGRAEVFPPEAKGREKAGNALKTDKHKRMPLVAEAKSAAEKIASNQMEALLPVNKSFPDKKSGLETLSAMVARDSTLIKQEAEARKLQQLTNQKGNAAGKQAVKIIVVDLRTPEQVRISERGQVRTQKQPQKAATAKLLPGILAGSGKIPTGFQKPGAEIADKDNPSLVKGNAQKGLFDSVERQSLFRQANPLNAGKDQSAAGSESKGTFAQRLNEIVRNEVIRNTNFIIKNDGNGEIRLILKPEALGQIRIKLNLNNNHIDGQIIVENNTIKEMLEASLKNLDQAFKEAGFESTSLGVSVGQERSNQGDQTSFRPEQSLTNDKVARHFENNQTGLVETIRAESLINMVV